MKKFFENLMILIVAGISIFFLYWAFNFIFFVIKTLYNSIFS